LKEKYRDDLSTYLDIDSDLWLKIKLSSGLDKNRVYKLSNTMKKNLLSLVNRDRSSLNKYETEVKFHRLGQHLLANITGELQREPLFFIQKEMTETKQ
jgi:hypothetical protein